MKKTINILLVLFLAFILSSCFGSNDDQINQAKKNLGVIESDYLDNDSGSNIDLQNEEITDSGTVLDDETTAEVKKVEINNQSDDQFIELDDLSNEDLTDGEVEISGNTLVNVDKIIITYENSESDFPTDVYTLKQFTSGGKTFLYRAFSKYQTFDYGKNIYTIDAYSGDKVSKTQLIINYPKEQEKTATEKVEQVSEQISLDTLPVSSAFGNPVDLGNGRVSYSDLKGLEIQKYTLSDLTCENLSTVLSDKMNTWFFWNTCRPIATNEGFSFFIVRLDGEKYVYEKHYYLSYMGIYGVQELETGVGVDLKNISEKNQELKLKNEDYPILKVSDDLFNQMAK